VEAVFLQLSCDCPIVLSADRKSVTKERDHAELVRFCALNQEAAERASGFWGDIESAEVTPRRGSMFAA